jgi:hypothetical protein
MFYIAENHLNGIFSCLQKPAENIKVALQGFGENVTRLMCTPEIVVVQRLMIAEAGRAGVGKIFYEKLFARREEIAAFIGLAMATGKLRRADTHLASDQLRALLEAEIFYQYILCVRTTVPNDAEIAALTERALDTFYRIYTPHEK